MTRTYSSSVLDKSRKRISCILADTHSGDIVAEITAIYVDGWLDSLNVRNFSMIGCGLSTEINMFISRSFMMASGTRFGNDLFESSMTF